MPRLSPIDRILIAAAGLLAPQLLVGQLAATTIEFAPRVTTQLQRYGSEEGDALRSAILAAVACRDLPRAAKQSRHAPQGGVGPSLTRTRS